MKGPCEECGKLFPVKELVRHEVRCIDLLSFTVISNVHIVVSYVGHLSSQISQAEK